MLSPPSNHITWPSETARGTRRGSSASSNGIFKGKIVPVAGIDPCGGRDAYQSVGHDLRSQHAPFHLTRCSVVFGGSNKRVRAPPMVMHNVLPVPAS